MKKHIFKLVLIVGILAIFTTGTVFAASGNGSSNSSRAGSNQQDQGSEENQGNGSMNGADMEAMRTQVQERREEQKADMEAYRLSYYEIMAADQGTLTAEKSRVQAYQDLIHEELQIMKQMTEEERIQLRNEIEDLHSECKYMNRYELEIRSAYQERRQSIDDSVTAIVPGDLTPDELAEVNAILDDL